MADKTFTYGDGFKVTEEMKNFYDEYGFLIVRKMFDSEELSKVWKLLETPDGIMKHRYHTDEPDGRTIERIIFCQPGNDVSGMISRSEKVVETCEGLLGGEVYHYHSKFIMKDPHKGGELIWHQDFGYWYNYGCLFPQLISAFIALDPCMPENGGLQVVPGSNKCGRIQHIPDGNLQVGADMDRVREIFKLLPVKDATLERGDVLFIHCNILHVGLANNSDLRRWVYIACYNRASNSPIKEHPYGFYTPIDKVPNEAIRNCTNFTDFSGKMFKHPLTEKNQNWPPAKNKS